MGPLATAATDSLFDLPLIVLCIEVAQRAVDKAVAPDAPLFITTDADVSSRAARAAVVPF